MAARQGLLGKSFALAAEAYSDAVGGSMSADSLRRITEGWGEQVREQREEEARRANAPAQKGETPNQRRVTAVEPIRGQANLSTDGGMVRVRDEEWKEVKLTVVSEVEVRPAAEGEVTGGDEERGEDPLVSLKGHSYQAGLWDADTMALYQYAEGVRRGVDACQRLSSVNDGAPWIERITDLNFPGVIQIVDWCHAVEKLWKVGQAVYGEGTEEGKAWVKEQQERLWQGKVGEVETALEQLGLDQEHWPDEVRQAPGYFAKNRKRMRYADFRAKGLPIGSGTVESGIKTVVHHRLKRPGRGWKRTNAQAMLAGLSELHSGRFDRAWQATLPLAA